MHSRAKPTFCFLTQWNIRMTLSQRRGVCRHSRCDYLLQIRELLILIGNLCVSTYTVRPVGVSLNYLTQLSLDGYILGERKFSRAFPSAVKLVCPDLRLCLFNSRRSNAVVQDKFRILILMRTFQSGHSCFNHAGPR
jgi:hypothetical protein